MTLVDPYVNRTGSVTRSPATPLTMREANVSVASSGDNVAIVAVPNVRLRIHALALTFASSVDVTFKDAASGNTLGVFSGVTEIVLDPLYKFTPRFITAVGGAFVINLSAAVACKGSVWYTHGATA